MNEQEFVRREAMQYLIEDNQVALIEWSTRLIERTRFLSHLLQSPDYELEIEPAALSGYLYGKVREKSWIEGELVRERTNRRYLLAKASEL